MSRPSQGYALVLGLLWSVAAAHAQFSFSDQNAVSSVSGQFLVTSPAPDAPVYPRPVAADNPNVIRFKTALLAVSAERFKLDLWRQLELPPNAAWSGKIHLRLHPAATPTETVTIRSSRFLNGWSYLVDLPDQLWKTRYARALAGVLLLEIANRSAGPQAHSAEIPAWLVDGLAQQILASDEEKVVLSAPRRKIEELAVNRINLTEPSADPFAGARGILQTAPALTFDQLSWPTDGQMEGADGGVYYASAQLFQAELLGTKQGPEKLRAMLAALPSHLNWQTAFFQAFGDNFKRPVEVEKWWALRVLNFASHAPGPRWTTEVSMARLQALLSVPVESRSASNALPTHSTISLQAALRDLNPEQRDLVLATTVRNLALDELRLAPPFGNLADGYRTTLADFLEAPLTARQVVAANKHGVPSNRQTSIAATLEKLAELDRRRHEAEGKSGVALPGRTIGRQ